MDRRSFLRLTEAVGLAATSLGGRAGAAPDERTAHRPAQPSPSPARDQSTADILVDTLIAWGAPFVFGVALAKACGADGYRCATPDEVRPALEAALRSPHPALVEAVVDPGERPAKPGELKA